MKTGHKLFFAIPFDSATKNLYERIRKKITRHYPTVTALIGNEEVGPSQEYSDIASFKAQNRELTRQFVAQIKTADIVIADLTNNNPNVHVELGIALMENKNILRVTGRAIAELGFDIRNLEVYQYNDENHLAKKILTYLDTFFKIKALPLTNDLPSLYGEEPRLIELRAYGKGKGIQFQSNIRQDFVLRDGGLQIEFEFLQTDPKDNWFGLIFRAGSHPFIGSHLVLVRQGGSIELVVFPGPLPIETLGTGVAISGRQIVTIQFENNTLEISLGGKSYRSERLSHQTAGRVFYAAWGADVNVHSAKAICRDTIEWA
jgi:nucleoside 2-deoxyribosyltransferase